MNKASDEIDDHWPWVVEQDVENREIKAWAAISDVSSNACLLYRHDAAVAGADAAAVAVFVGN